MASVAPKRQKRTAASMALIYSLLYGFVIQCTDSTSSTSRTWINCIKEVNE